MLLRYIMAFAPADMAVAICLSRLVDTSFAAGVRNSGLAIFIGIEAGSAQTIPTIDLNQLAAIQLRINSVSPSVTTTAFAWFFRLRLAADARVV